MSLDIDSHIAHEREQLFTHPLFAGIRTVEDVRTLMEVHVFAVWDFMTLLKRIQRDLTCVNLPWVPPAHITAARLINEIVVGEETDEHPGGGFISHLDLYLIAMEEIGADTSVFRRFLAVIQSGESLAKALADPCIPLPAKVFVCQTLDVAQHGTTEAVLAYFFFGREDIIPDMFGGLLKEWSVSEADAPMFTYYLKRHIEMDGDDHGPAAKRIIAEIVTTPEQHRNMVENARSAIVSRIALWDGVQHLMGRAVPATCAHEPHAQLAASL
ncbi:DUF3050 domain-containing protein [Pseudomonas monteilii]|uniref:DUF3050 domain-containing protein n=1 Tax=Pseudomonas alabamensis TaxID=3064349 RepID=UPI0027136408|nr:DUF3050 domain-containing protein [Pseudomonas sp. 22-AL-CL-001]MDO7912078.1 DUF3050 domain-containing protein [Pseudomonas sp. 22-AL-CL-001]